jgi:biopolymer transport protein ExbD
MNIFIVLIPMLLLSAVFLEIRAIEMAGGGPAAAAQAPVESLDLAIHVGATAYVVTGEGLAAREIPRAAPAGGAAVADASAGELDRVLREIVAAHPDNREVRIVASEHTRYDEIVTLMDIARAAGLPQAALEGEEAEV